MKIFGREPAVILQACGAVIMCLGLALHFTLTQQTLLNAVCLLVVGVITAAVVHDGMSAAVLGLVKGLLACVLGFGMHITQDWQTAIMMVVAAAVVMFVRQTVTAPINPAGNKVTAAPVAPLVKVI